MRNEAYNSIDLNQTKDHIAKYGHSVVTVGPSSYLPSFAYTVGLTENLNHPEIICFGLKQELMHNILNDVAQIIKFGGPVQVNKEYLNIFSNSRAIFLKVDKRNVEDYFKVVGSYYERWDFEAIQLVWTDRGNIFPWEENFQNAFRFKQPLLDRNADFKFFEERNLGVFTTPKWMEEQAPILRVIHDSDGDWQFFTKEVDFDNGKVVSLEQMIASDKTLNSVFNLEYGEQAERQWVGDKWMITSL